MPNKKMTNKEAAEVLFDIVEEDWLDGATARDTLPDAIAALLEEVEADA